jgi:zinc protease
LDKIRALVEKYLASLPSTGRNETWEDIEMDMPNGIVENTVRKGIDPKSMVRVIFNGDFEYIQENRHILKSLEGVMEIKLREIMREDMGGTYGVWIWSSESHYPEEKYEFNIMFGCSPENVDTLTQALFTQIDSLQSYGIDIDYISKVQEKQRQAREVDLQENKFWLDSISFYYYHGETPLNILDYDKLIDELSVDVIQAAAKDYLNTDNYVKVVLYPESVE